MTQLDRALETVRQIHHKELRDERERVIKKLLWISNAQEPNSALTTFIYDLRRQNEQSSSNFRSLTNE